VSAVLLAQMRSEWTKLRTVRSSVWTIAVTVVVGIGVSALATGEVQAHWATMSPPTRAGFNPVSVSLTAAFFCQLVLGVLGVLVMSAEYGTGTIRATFSAVPRRTVVLAAKVAVFGLVALVVGETVTVLSFLVGQAMLSSPVPHATFATPDALRAVVGTGLYLCVIGLIGLGLATILRHTAGAISAFVGVLLVLPIIVAALPSGLQHAISRFLPLQMGQALMQTRPLAHAFGPWTGFAVLVGYAAAVLAVALALLVRRDA
jgi:ABC-2 type transport system permease protein